MALLSSSTGSTGRVAGLALLAALALALRLYRLDDLPAEPWDDVITHATLARDVAGGRFFIGFRFGGDGPVFSYLLALPAKLGGLSFYTMKLATAIAGACLTLATYAYTHALFERRHVALLAAFLSAVSFWSLTWSRQAKPHILVPLLVAVTFTFALRGRGAAAGIALGLGCYTQAGFWGMLAVPFALRATYLAALLVLAPLAVHVLAQPQTYLTGASFFGEKLGLAAGFGPADYATRLATNVAANVLAFHVHGDRVFRHNVPGQPHLDPVSGLFFALGVAAVLWRVARNRDWRLLRYGVVPLVVLQVPSVLDVRNPQSLPNMGRMIAILPCVLAVTAYGIVETDRLFRQVALPRLRHRRVVSPLDAGRECRAGRSGPEPGISPRRAGREGWLRPVARWGMRAGPVILLAVLIAAINARSYFVVYPRTLPDGNTPFGRTIAGALDAYPLEFVAYVAGCCWGEWRQPEPGSVALSLRRPRAIHFLQPDRPAAAVSCRDLAPAAPGQRVVIVTSPRPPAADGSLDACLLNRRTWSLTRNGIEVARMVEGEWRQ
jgi:hypothetical protein